MTAPARPSGLRRAPSEATTPAVVALILGTLLGMAWASRPSYWFDEAATLSAAERSPGRLWTLLHHVDAVHGLYYGLMSGWVRLVGTGEAATRGFSAVGLGATCGLVALLGAELGGRRLAWSAGLAAVVLPGLAWSGTEARQFSWSAALATAATLALLRARGTGRARHWIAYGAALTLGAYLFLFSLLLVVAHLLTLLLLPGRVARSWWAATGVAAGLSLPLAVTAVGQFDRQLGWLSLEPASVLVQMGFSQYFLSSTTSGSRSAMLGAAALLALTVLLVIRCVRAAGRSREARDVLRVAVPWAVLPSSVLALVSVLGHPVYQQRYLTFCAPGVALVIGAGLVATSLRPQAIFVVGLAIVVAAFPVLVGQKQVDSKNRDNYRVLADFLGPRGHDVPGVVLSAAGEEGILVSYPERVHGVRVLNRGVDPLASTGLWGTLHGPRRTVLAPGTEVGLVSLTAHPERARRWVRWLRVHDCRAVGRVRERRYTARVYHCRSARRRDDP